MVIEIINLKKSYKELIAVNNINLHVEKGEIFGMLGHNGAGKTTTIECIAGITNYDSGTIKILSKEISLYKNSLYDFIGVQLQETMYQDKIKVKEICKLFSTFYKNPLDYKKLLKRFDIESKLNNYVSQLSGGQRQKLSITLSLIGNPKNEKSIGYYNNRTKT